MKRERKTKMAKTKRKLLSVLLALCTLVGLVPTMTLPTLALLISGGNPELNVESDSYLRGTTSVKVSWKDMDCVPTNWIGIFRNDGSDLYDEAHCVDRYYTSEDTSSYTFPSNNSTYMTSEWWKPNGSLASGNYVVVPFRSAGFDMPVSLYTDSFTVSEYNAVYYMADGGTGSGTSYNDPAGSAEAIVKKINDDGYGAGDEICVYLLQNNIKVNDTLDKDTMMSMAQLYHEVHHDANITYTTYKYDDESKNYAVLSTYCQFPDAGKDASLYGTTHKKFFFPQGNETFKNIALLDTNVLGHSEFFTQGYNVEFENTPMYKTTFNTANSDYVTVAKKQTENLYSGTNRTGHGTLGSGGRVSIDDGSLFSALVFGGYIDPGSTQTMGSDVAFEINHTSVGTVSLANTAGKMVYAKNVNLILNDSTVTTFNSQGYTGLNSTVGGAVQVILNGDSSITTCKPTEKAVGSDGESNVPLYIVKAASGVTLDVTETTGVYSFTSTSGKVWAKDSDRNIIASVDDKLTLPKAGTYTVTATEPSYYDGEYYLKAGATGGNGKSADSPLASVTELIAAVKADGLDTDSSYIIAYVMRSDDSAIKIGETVTIDDVQADCVPYFDYTYTTHKAKIRYTTYDYDEETKNYAVIAYMNQLIYKGDGNLHLRGPSEFVDITLLDVRADVMAEIYASGYDLTLSGVNRWHAYKNEIKTENSTEVLVNAKIQANGNPTVVYNGTNRFGRFSTLGQGGRVVIDNCGTDTFMLFYGSFVQKDNAATDVEKQNKNFANDVTFEINDTTATNIYLSGAGYANNVKLGMTYQKNVNLILNNATATSLDSNKYTALDTKIGGAIQILLNQGSKITNNNLTSGFTNLEGEANVPVYILNGSSGVKLDVTETAGVYTVLGDGKVAATCGAKTYFSTDGVLTLPKAGTYTVVPYKTETRYVMYGKSGSGLSANDPMGSTKDAIAAIEATDCYDGEVVIMNNPAYEGTYFEVNGTKTKYTYWTKPAAHTKHITVRGEKGQDSVLATQENINTGDIVIQGPTTFTNITLLRMRDCDEGVMSGGYDLTLTSSVLLKGISYTYHEGGNPVWYYDSKSTIGEKYTTFIKFGSGRVAKSGNGGKLTINIPKELSVFAEHDTTASTYSNDMTLKVDNGNNPLTVDWARSAKTVYGKNLNIVLDNVKSFTQVFSAGNNTYTATVNGDLQVIHGKDLTFAKHDNMVVRGGIYELITDQVGKLDVTDKSGVYTVSGGKIAWTQTDDKRSVYYGDETLTIPSAGQYTVHFAETLDEIKAAITEPTDLDPGYEFHGWLDDGKGTITADIPFVMTTYFVSESAGDDNNDGKTEATAVKTIKRAAELIFDDGTVITAVGGAIMLLDNVTAIEIPTQSDRLTIRSKEGATLAGAENVIALNNAPKVTLEAELAAGQTVKMGKNTNVILAGKVDSENPVTVIFDGCGTETLTIKGKYVKKLYTKGSDNSGALHLEIDGGTLENLVVGSTDANDAVVKGDIRITVKSGKFIAMTAGTAKNIRADNNNCGFRYVANADSYYFGGKSETFDGKTVTEWVDKTTEVTADSETLPNVMFKNKIVIRSSDTENTIEWSGTSDIYDYSGNKTPYVLYSNGTEVYYGKDGKIEIPKATVDVLWTDTFDSSKLPAPKLDDGYVFDGWLDNGNGKLTAKVLQPQDYYVDAQYGSDDNRGTSAAAAFKTLEAAYDAIVAANAGNGNIFGTVHISGKVEWYAPDVLLDGKISIVGEGDSAEICVPNDDEDEPDEFELYVRTNTVFENVKLSTASDGGSDIMVNPRDRLVLRNVTVDEKSTLTVQLNPINESNASGYWLVLDNVDAKLTVIAVGNLGDGDTSISNILLSDTTVETFVPLALDGQTMNDGEYVIKFGRSHFNILCNNGATIKKLTKEYSGIPLSYESLNIYVNGTMVTPAGFDSAKDRLVTNDDPNTTLTITDKNGTVGVITDVEENGALPIAVNGDSGCIYVANSYNKNNGLDLVPYAPYKEQNDGNEYADYINYRKPLTNTYKKLTEDKKLNVVYYGGSVTAGYGSSNAEQYSWRALIGQWLVNNFPNATITNINRASGESGTRLGFQRLNSAVIDSEPDLLFFEYTINDNYDTYNQGLSNKDELFKSQCETILREVKQKLPNCDIVMVIVTDAGKIETNRNNNTGIDRLHYEGKIHENLAIAYNIPSLWVGPALSDTLEGENLTEWKADWNNYAIDSVHLNDAGNNVYYKVIREFMRNELFRTNYDGIESRYDELPKTQNVIFDPERNDVGASQELITASEALGGTGFTYNASTFSGIPAVQSYGGHGLVSSGADSTFVYKFTGTDMSIFSNYYADNQLMVKIDDGEFTPITGFKHAPTVIAKDLESGEHTVIIKEAPNQSKRLAIGILFTRDSSKNVAADTAFAGYSDKANYTIKLQTGGIYKFAKAATVGEAVAPLYESFVVNNVLLNNQSKITTATKISLGDVIEALGGMSANDYFNFLGVQIRLGNPEKSVEQGLRFVVEKKKEVPATLSAAFEFGMVVLPSAYLGDTRTYADYNADITNSTYQVVGADKLKKGSTHTVGEKTYNSATVVGEKIFKELDSTQWYTTCLTGISDTGYGTYYTLRPYITYTSYFDGQVHTAYADAFRSNVYEVAKRILADTSAGETEKALATDIVSAVEGSFQTSEN